MDTTWLFVAFLLVLLFAGISIIGALNRIREATEKSARLLEQLVAERTGETAKPE